MKRIKLAIAALAAIVVTSTASAQTAASVIEKFNKAAELVNKDKNYAAAATLFEEVVKEGTPLGTDVSKEVANAKKLIPQMYFRIGSAYASQGKFNEAIASLGKASTKAGEYKDVLWQKRSQDQIVNVYLKQGGELFNAKKYTEAIPFLEKAYNLDQNNATAAFNLANCYVEAGKRDQGFALYKKLISMGATNTRYKSAADQAQQKMENYQSIDAINAVKAKNYPKALSLLEGLIKENPKNATAQLMLIQTLNMQKNYAAIIQKGNIAAEAQTSPANKSEIYYIMGAAYDNQKNTDKAIESFKKVTAGSNVANAKAQVTELSKAK